MASHLFDAFFLAATGHSPYDYQRRLATDSPPGSGGGQGAVAGRFPSWTGGGQGVVVEGARSRLIHIPTGLGKVGALPRVGGRAFCGRQFAGRRWRL